ncbi:ABC transporter ATP-binding protein [Cohnella sp. JJ-181]|uniref:ABC transporter ATP-binding protein n=1 Tax=Cohnella rhizoplanae TaxID=2974897 RepID=UPI0022FF52C9|nr:dipeptide ABC transporter ATP-binding protein [Cohnella sp. JJ-181]CAI6085709.1 Oligopeptide transport ATP-binding protein OppF [Cohnella sp. JJ-181]
MNENKEVLAEVKNLRKSFPVNKGMLWRRRSGAVRAINDVSFNIYKGETLGLIGESGCGKTTLSRIMMGLTDATEGEVLYKGQQVGAGAPSAFRKEVQMIFQDPYSSLDPRMNIRRIIEEPMRIHTKLSARQKLDRILFILEKIGLDEDALERFPHEFSGGQRQRIGIARALVLQPELLICDEPVSALDMSVQAQILNLFKQLQQEMKLTYLFISHDMSVVKHVSDRVMVMYLGRIMELAPKRKLFGNTLHPYTSALMSAIPLPNPELRRARTLLEGDLPSPLNPPAGCPFQTRCPKAQAVCRTRMPALQEAEKDHFVACHLYSGEAGA